MVDRIEVDYAQLQQIQKRLQARADELEQDYRTLLSKRDNLRNEWRGKGADNFFDEMSNFATPAYRRLIESLDKIDYALNQIAQVMRTAEEQASNLFKGGTVTMELRRAVVGASLSSDTYTKPTRQDYQDGGTYLRNGEDMPNGYKPDVIFVAGIGTNADAFNQHLEITGGQHTNQNFMAIFNSTEKSDNSSFPSIGDVFQALGDKIEAATGFRIGPDNPAVISVKDQIEQAIQDGRSLTLKGHSQGGAIISAALMEYHRENPNADLSKITVITYGSAGTVFPDGIQSTHYENMLDYVPKLARFADMFIPGGYNREYHENLVLLPPTQLEPHGLQGYYNNIEFVENVGQAVDNVIEDVGEFSSNMMNKGKDLFNRLTQ